MVVNLIFRLRRNFILVAMVSMFIVLSVIVGSLNVASYLGTVDRADRILEMLSENEGRFPDVFSKKNTDRLQPRQPGDKMKDFSPETPFETRFFSVRINGSGESISVDTGRIAAVETEDAIAMASEVFSKGKEKGFFGNYRYCNQILGDTDQYRIIFVDCSKELTAFYNLLENSIIVSLFGLSAVFLLVFILSGKVFRPVEESYRKQKQFITDASHELKTPLTIISANIDILEMDGGENQWTASIHNQVGRLRTLTEQMVMLSRLDESNGKKNTESLSRCNLSETFREVTEEFTPLAVAKGKKLTVRCEGEIYIKGDREKLAQMLGLLLDNGIKYSSRDSEILVTLEPCVKKNYHCKLSVKNAVSEDSGITVGNQDILFERFYRPDCSRSAKSGGSGIGLSVVKALVEFHGGKVTAESTDGKTLEVSAWL